jgi:pilus assembly protein CpaE
VEKYDSVVVDLGRSVTSELATAALQVASQVYLVMSQEFPAIRNAQRYLGYLMRLGFSQDQVKILVNQYQKKPGPQLATLDQIQSTLNMKVFYGIPSSAAVLASINKSRPFVANREAAGDLDRVFRLFVDKATGRNKEEMAKSA